MPQTAVWSTLDPLTAITTKLTAIPAVQHVYVGIPKAPERRLCAYVTVGGQVFSNVTTGGQVRRTISYRAVFTYGVESDPAGSEQAVANVIDTFIAAIYNDRTLGGTLEELELDASEADRPQYAQLSGEEYRQYPITLRGKQRTIFSIA